MFIYTHVHVCTLETASKPPKESMTVANEADNADENNNVLLQCQQV